MNIVLVLAAIAATLVVVFGLVQLGTANRLDRLHVRMDAGWAALDNALTRRAVVARALAVTALDREAADRLRASTERAETASRREREAAENALSELLGRVDRTRLPVPLATELADAEQRIVIARRVHNDAVRDTLTVRRLRRVRYFRLAGTAPLPEYFEIAEPEPASAEDETTPGRLNRSSRPGVPGRSGRGAG